MMRNIQDHINEVAGKKVIVRCNFDVPIEDGKVGDTTRIEDALSTIELLREHGCQLTLVAHAGRPDGVYNPEKSLEPVRKELEKFLNQPVQLLEYKEQLQDITQDSGHSLSLLENIRFWSGEEAKDSDFAQQLATFGEVYVNQAFANCHRDHASMTLLPKILPAYAGVNLSREVGILSKVRNNPDKPLVIVIGGAKLETKEPLVSVFADVADSILVGGKVALDLREQHKELPQNVVVAELVETGRDISPESAQLFASKIMAAETVMWNGTMGVFEEDEYKKGTKIVANAINTTNAFTIVGGGDTETALTELQMETGIDFISTGGGAMLTYLSEGSLVALEALKD